MSGEVERRYSELRERNVAWLIGVVAALEQCQGEAYVGLLADGPDPLEALRRINMVASRALAPTPRAVQPEQKP